ncbi:MAG: peptidylprolyl isomerase [Alphaproteobacteria bacterium]|nr:MAG: peptidylprolyl isomerase [Alphaproteobacteria bacterium]
MRRLGRILSAAAAVALGVLIAGGPAAARQLVIELAGGVSGTVVIELAEDVAPRHAERLATLAASGAYDGVAFHRVIEGFMAQTGDVRFGNVLRGYDPRRVGTGGSDLPDLPAEFSDLPFARGTVGMARAADPNSANSQFFIMFAPAPHLNGQYTVVGHVVSGMELVDRIRRGRGRSGMVADPDYMARVTVRDEQAE